MPTYGYSPPKPPRSPQVSDAAYRTYRQTSGYQEPFPSLSARGTNTQLPKVTGSFTTPNAKPKPPPAAVQPQVTNPSQAAPAAPATPGVSYSYDADPILNQIQGLSMQGREQATGQATGLRRKVAQDYGDVGLARQYGGEEDAQAAQNNPNSVLAQLARSFQTGQQSLDEGLNQANLFYSGARIKQQGDLANQYQTQQYQAGQDEQGALGGIESNLAAALAAADQRDLQAQQDAYSRQLQAALSAGGTGQGAAAPEGITGVGPGAPYGTTGGLANYPELDFTGIPDSPYTPGATYDAQPAGSTGGWANFPELNFAAPNQGADGWADFPQLNFGAGGGTAGDDIAAALGLAPQRRRAGATASGFRGIL